jgi:antitoxin (DNA-binding transcriptional repressor) of toxin-antitoxin stability system
METVNALKVRNHLGEILERLNKTGEPILISKGRRIQAVLVTPDQFRRRFLDVISAEKRKRFLDEVRGLRKRKKEDGSSIEVLRQLRGYEA